MDRVTEEMQLSEVHFIKLDVDGYECPELAGGSKTLRTFRPTIVLELASYVHVEHGHTMEELIDLLAQSAYRLRTIDGSGVLPAEPAALRKLIPDGGSINILAVPA